MVNTAIQLLVNIRRPSQFIFYHGVGDGWGQGEGRGGGSRNG